MNTIGMKSLVIEDGFTSRRVLQSILSQFGQCDAFSNGIEGMDAFVKAIVDKDTLPYNLICLDIMMPLKDGHEVLREIRSIEGMIPDYEKKRAKVIMITSLADYDNIKKAYTEQCEGYLVKPFEKEKLIAKLKELRLI